MYACADGSLGHLAWLEDELDRGARRDYLAQSVARRQAALDRIVFAQHSTSPPLIRRSVSLPARSLAQPAVIASQPENVVTTKTL